jgi:hypothetical protein
MGTISAKLLDKYRDIHVEHDSWWLDVYGQWVDTLIEKGINTDSDSMSFSGFWCQGDGACFTGMLNVEKFMEVHGLTEQYPGAYHFAKRGDLEISLDSNDSRYSHEHTVSAELRIYERVDYEAAEQGDVRAAIDVALLDAYHEQACELEKVVNDTCRSYMRGLYHDLEEEHEHLTSDETVTAWLELNNISDEDDDDDEGEADDFEEEHARAA